MTSDPELTTDAHGREGGGSQQTMLGSWCEFCCIARWLLYPTCTCSSSLCQLAEAPGSVFLSHHRRAAVLQVNEFVKRVRAAKIHILIMGYLRRQMPAMMGKQKTQEKLLRNLSDHFAHVQREYHLPVGMPAGFSLIMNIPL